MDATDSDLLRNADIGIDSLLIPGGHSQVTDIEAEGEDEVDYDKAATLFAGTTSMQNDFYFGDGEIQRPSFDEFEPYVSAG